MLRRAARWVTQTFAPPSERRPTDRFRPRVETLEARVVPAFTFFWTGLVDADFDKPGNWMAMMIAEGPPPPSLPGAEDHLVFAPFPENPFEDPEARPCENIHPPGSGAYGSVTLTEDYDSTVTVEEGFSTRGLFLDGGTIDQPSSGTDITVIGGFFAPANESFIWTGGTLNSSSHIATVNITGSSTTGLIAPAGAGTVSLGSTLDVENGSVLTVHAGTLDFLNGGSEINIRESCGFLIAPGQLGTITTSGDSLVGNPTTLFEGGWCKVEGGYVNGSQMSLLNAGGSVIIEPNGHLYLGKNVPDSDETCSFEQAFGATYLAANATIEVEYMMFVRGGAIVQKSGSKPQGFDGNVVGDLLLHFGDVQYQNMAGVGAHEFGEFRVNGNVQWNGGTYRPVVSSVSNELSDRWTAIGTFAIGIGGSTALDPTAVDLSGIGAIPNSDMTWEILLAVGGFVNNNTPSFDNNTWALDPVGNPQTTVWKLRKR